MGAFLDILKTPIVVNAYTAIHSFRTVIQKKYLIRVSKRRQLKKLRELKGKRTIKCIMLVFDSACFRDYLYRLLCGNNRFEVAVVVCPIHSQNQEYREKRLVATYETLVDKGYNNVLMGYDVNTKKYLDIRKELKPDIIIYTNPYRSLIGENFYITKFSDVLTIYLPYYINNTVEYELAYDELLHNVVWRYYVETEWHKMLSQKYSSNQSRNVVVSGYSGFDLLLDKKYKPTDDCWKIKDRSLKRIVWAPHQTINPNHSMYYSAFLLIADQMTEFAIKYKDKIQIAFKPHPLLINSLYREWGQERSDAFYEKWRTMENTCIVDGSYVDLFLTSDAIIHDSASFITEYLILNRPALRTHNGRDLKLQFNDFSLACLEHYYMAYNVADVEQFILNLIGGIDPMKEARTRFISEQLLPPDGNLPSENIVRDILDSIDNQILYR